MSDEIIKSLGGNRLGSGNQMKVALHNYERSTHDLSRIWRSSMNCGTLVPFMVEPALPGDTFDINLTALAKTIPTICPLFGSFKFQADVFFVPARLYIKELHNNKSGIGMDMSKIHFPQVTLNCKVLSGSKRYDPTQISSSSLISYLGCNGLAGQYNLDGRQELKEIVKTINAIPYCGYFDIFKNYYANQQEKKCYIIESKENNIWEYFTQLSGTYTGGTAGTPETISINETINSRTNSVSFTLTGIRNLNLNLQLLGSINIASFDATKNLKFYDEGTKKMYTINEVVSEYSVDEDGVFIKKLKWLDQEKTIMLGMQGAILYYEVNHVDDYRIVDYDLTDVDDMREYLLTQSAQGSAANPMSMPAGTGELVKVPCKWSGQTTLPPENRTVKTNFQVAQGGLLLKTYQSDIFQNYLNAEELQGEGGINYINEQTKVAVTDGGFTIDSLLLAKKVYNMLNRIAVSGGTFRDWQEAVWGEKTFGHTETPIYCGSFSNEIVFDEIVSSAASGDQPLGTLAGRGTFRERKNNTIIIKPEEPGFIMGICSITPRIDYYQGNKWYLTNLENMSDLHAPALDGIGFQDLLIERFFAQGGTYYEDGTLNKNQAIGKQPAWIDYMTSFNEVHGDFTDDNKAGAMVLKRDYQYLDYTTYINPQMYNKAFADTSLGAQNFWIQIGIDCKARRKMSAKIMPNL